MSNFVLLMARLAHGWMPAPGKHRWTGRWFGPLLVMLFSNVGLQADDLPAIPLPPGANGLVRDSCANFWAIGPADSPGQRELLVLPAQAPTKWIVPKFPGLPSTTWKAITPQPDRSILVTDERQTWRVDPRTPEKGATEVARPTMDNAGVNPWRLAARMPASNHDLTGAAIGGRFYVAGGTTSDYGFPARPKAFDEILELDPATWTWRPVARFSRPRIYCATVAFSDQVWVVGGDILHEDGQRRATTLAQIYDPKTGALTRAPDLPVALPAPLALVAGGRLWVVGARNRVERGQLASISPDDTAWRIEPEAPPDMWALAGTTLGDKLYICIPNSGLSVFDPATGHWSAIPGPSRPRSAQVAAWRGELWIMGGCDIVDWSETRIYNPQQRSWRTGPSLPIPLAWGAAAVINDELIVTGGAGRQGPLENNNYVFSDCTFVLGDDAIPADRAARTSPVAK